MHQMISMDMKIDLCLLTAEDARVWEVGREVGDRIHPLVGPLGREAGCGIHLAVPLGVEAGRFEGLLVEGSLGGRRIPLI